MELFMHHSCLELKITFLYSIERESIFSSVNCNNFDLFKLSPFITIQELSIELCNPAIQGSTVYYNLLKLIL